MADDNTSFTELREAHDRILAQLKDVERERDTYRQQVEAVVPLAREHVFSKAGFNLSDPIQRLAVGQYDGPLTEESVTEWVATNGIQFAPAVTEVPNADQAAQATERRVDRLMTEGVTPSGGPPNVDQQFANATAAYVGGDRSAEMDVFQLAALKTKRAI